MALSCQTSISSCIINLDINSKACDAYVKLAVFVKKPFLLTLNVVRRLRASGVLKQPFFCTGIDRGRHLENNWLAPTLCPFHCLRLQEDIDQYHLLHRKLHVHERLLCRLKRQHWTIILYAAVFGMKLIVLILKLEFTSSFSPMRNVYFLWDQTDEYFFMKMHWKCLNARQMLNVFTYIKCSKKA